MASAGLRVIVGRLIRSAVQTWRDGLINLTGSNRLLNFRPSRTGMISLLRPSPEEVLSRLARGGRLPFPVFATQAGRR